MEDPRASHANDCSPACSPLRGNRRRRHESAISPERNAYFYLTALAAEWRIRMKKIRILFTIVLAIGLIGGLAGIVRQQLDYRKGAEDYAAAQALAGTPAVPDAPVEEPDAAEEPETAVDLAPLQAVNPDVQAWIAIPGTDLSYPVVQAADNDYYLTHTWKKESSSVGAIFLDYRSSAQFSDFNTLLYGHRMRNGSMFGSLKSYKDQTYWEQAPSIYLTDANGTHQYDIFAAYQAKTDAALYQPAVDSAEHAEEVLRYAATHSVIDTGISPTADDRILTLVTCTGTGYSARWIVQAVLVEE